MDGMLAIFIAVVVVIVSIYVIVDIFRQMNAIGNGSTQYHFGWMAVVALICAFAVVSAVYITIMEMGNLNG